MTSYKKGSLWLDFRLENTDYCILSDYIESIAVPTKIDRLPTNNNIVAGVVNYSNSLIGVIEMREVFGKQNLQKCVQDFGIMKDMHISWVLDLKRYVTEGGEFTKAVDPHKCMFGLWYDNFKTDNARLNRLLKKISVPHEHIHLCGAKIKELKAMEGDHQDEIDDWFMQAEAICYEDIVPLLDRLIDVYCSANRGVLLVVGIGDSHLGLLVDEVKSLISCTKTQQTKMDKSSTTSPYLGDIIVNGDQIMLEINVEELMHLA